MSIAELVKLCLGLFLGGSLGLGLLKPRYDEFGDKIDLGLVAPGLVCIEGRDLGLIMSEPGPTCDNPLKLFCKDGLVCDGSESTYLKQMLKG